jgi:hypothetical protein
MKLKQLSRRKKRSYKKAKKTGKQKDWRRFNDIKKEAQRLIMQRNIQQLRLKHARK